MPLAELSLLIPPTRLPRDVRSLIREARSRIRHFQRESHIPAFVPADYEHVYRVLHAVAEADCTPGRLFCEWGSGFGVVACLATLLDFEAFGIEIEEELVDAARCLAERFDLPVEFAHGSFIPEGDAQPTGEFSWLGTGGGNAYEQLGLAPQDFSLVFAYPWPDEEELTAEVFERHAATDAVLATYHPSGDFRLRRKIVARPAAS